MNILDKLAKYSPTFFLLVRGDSFNKFLESFRSQTDSTGKSTLTSLTDDKEEVIEINQATDGVRLWLQLSTQWIHLFQGLRSNTVDQRNRLLDFFKISCTFTRVIPPKAITAKRSTLEKSFECAGFNNPIDIHSKIKAIENLIYTKDVQAASWTEVVKLRSTVNAPCPWTAPARGPGRPTLACRRSAASSAICGSRRSTVV